MEETKDNSPVVQIEKLSDWQPVVMESKEPVILDCYAEWCAPCKKLEPILTQKVLALDGKIKLVKLNIDHHPSLSQGLNIRSIPALFLIFKGNIVDAITGMPEESKLDEFIQTGLGVGEVETSENIMAEVL